MIVKLHKTNDNKKIVAVCDSNLIGKKFEEKNLQLDLTSDFYSGEEKPEEVITKMFYDCYMINLVGKNSVNLALKHGIISENNIVYIKKIPHAQAILL